MGGSTLRGPHSLVPVTSREPPGRPDVSHAFPPAVGTAVPLMPVFRAPRTRADSASRHLDANTAAGPRVGPVTSVGPAGLVGNKRKAGLCGRAVAMGDSRRTAAGAGPGVPQGLGVDASAVVVRAWQSTPHPNTSLESRNHEFSILLKTNKKYSKSPKHFSLVQR